MRRVRRSGVLDIIEGGYNNSLNDSGALLCTASEGEAVLLDVFDIFVGENCSSSSSSSSSSFIGQVYY